MPPPPAADSTEPTSTRSIWENFQFAHTRPATSSTTGTSTAASTTARQRRRMLPGGRGARADGRRRGEDCGGAPSWLRGGGMSTRRGPQVVPPPSGRWTRRRRGGCRRSGNTAAPGRWRLADRVGPTKKRRWSPDASGVLGGAGGRGRSRRQPARRARRRARDETALTRVPLDRVAALVRDVGEDVLRRFLGHVELARVSAHPLLTVNAARIVPTRTVRYGPLREPALDPACRARPVRRRHRRHDRRRRSPSERAPPSPSG